MTELEIAELRLASWAIAHAKRDEIVWDAYRAGCSKVRIALLSGIARTTIDRIVYSRQSTVDYLSLQ